MVTLKRGQAKIKRNPKEVNGEFVWTPQRILAAQLLAENSEKNRVIASRCDTTEVTVWNWSQHPAFQAKVKALQKLYEEAILGKGLAKKARRIEKLGLMAERVEKVVEARASHPRYNAVDPKTGVANVPGGDQGLIAVKEKSILTGFDKKGNPVMGIEREEQFDAALVRTYNQTIKQIQEEVEPLEIALSGKGGGPVQVNAEMTVTVGVELRNFLEEMRSARRLGPIIDTIAVEEAK